MEFAISWQRLTENRLAEAFWSASTSFFKIKLATPECCERHTYNGDLYHRRATKCCHFKPTRWCDSRFLGKDFLDWHRCVRDRRGMASKHSEATAGVIEPFDDQAIARAAAQLELAINDKCEELARELTGSLLNNAEWGLCNNSGNPGQRSDQLQLELTKLRIRYVANTELGAAVAAARLAGATWSQVGNACGSSKQAAYERWHKVVKKFEQARHAAERRPIDPLDQYDPPHARHQGSE